MDRKNRVLPKSERTPEDKQLVLEIKERLTKLVNNHNVHCDQPDCYFEAGIVGWVAHVLGVRGHRWDDAKDILADYDANCPGCGHQN